ncbi:hypothetical protein F4811DRAFT_548361 [Daldinia bambusicola]|nr:hypothetical protein F4811DRAFT_548361 [Daldinia bambusicola]
MVEMTPEFHLRKETSHSLLGTPKQPSTRLSLPPQGVNGKFLINGDNGEHLGVPYFGVGCDLNLIITSIRDYGGNYPWSTSGVSDTRIEQKSK